MSATKFWKNAQDKMQNMAMEHIEENAHAIASSILDPETGKHAEVFARRTNENTVKITTSGSPSFARELERRLGVDTGAVAVAGISSPSVYVAHAFEDKVEIAEPLASFLRENGVDAWLDKWEIQPGDSLRQKMDEGLSNCTHFLVLLTPTSINKPWVKAEVDAGFLKAIEDRAKFIGIRIGLEAEELPPLLKTRLCPEMNLSDDGDLNSLLQTIFGKSDKPALGPQPSFVKSTETGLSAWSDEAVTLAKFLVQKSELGEKFDPQIEVLEVVEDTELSEDDVRVALLDLEGAGLIERASWNRDCFYPLKGLFVEFDRYFLGFDNREDARVLAKMVVGLDKKRCKTEDIKTLVPEWNDRRFNSAIQTLEELKAVKTLNYMGGRFAYQEMVIGEETIRFVRRHAPTSK